MSLDKYHKLLECVESLDFDNGDFINICNTLKKLRDDATKSEDIKYKVDIKFKYKGHILEYNINKIIKYAINGWKHYYCYTFTKDNILINSYSHPLKELKFYMFNKIRHSTDIEIQYYTEDDKDVCNHYTTFGEAKRELGEGDEKECELEEHDECEHGQFNNEYVMTLLLGFNDTLY